MLSVIEEDDHPGTTWTKETRDRSTARNRPLRTCPAILWGRVSLNRLAASAEEKPETGEGAKRAKLDSKANLVPVLEDGLSSGQSSVGSGDE